MRKTLLCFIGLMFVCCMIISSCSESLQGDTFDPYENWKVRNQCWFRDSIMAKAKDSIALAKSQYGDAEELWQPHCRWRIYRSLLRSTTGDTVTNSVFDSIVVYINGYHEIHGTNADGIQKGMPPSYNDSVQVNYRGYLMPNEYYDSEGMPTEIPHYPGYREQFTSNYYGNDNDIAGNTVAPMASNVSGLVEGFSTAVQHMVPGDDWTIYIPYQLGYGTSSSGKIKSYSTLEYRTYLYDWYEAGHEVPEWCSRKK